MTLHIPMRAIYFDEIARGEKLEEYRLVTAFWRKRLEGRTYSRIILTRGYPKGGGFEGSTRLTLPWRGYQIKTITHPHFGPDPVEVFAIDVSPLPDGLYFHDGSIKFECRGCGQLSEWPADIEDFKQDAHENMCGSSPRCCP